MTKARNERGEEGGFVDFPPPTLESSLSQITSFPNERGERSNSNTHHTACQITITTN